MMTHEDRIDQLARSVLGRGGPLSLGLLKVYAEAAGVEVLGGGWLRLPNQHTAQAQGWRQFATALLDHGDTEFGCWTDVRHRMSIAATEAEDVMRVPTSQEPAATAVVPDLSTLTAKVNFLLTAINALAAAQPADSSRAAAVTVVVGDECDLVTLREAGDHIASRIVKRAAYEMGKALLNVLEGSIEDAEENCEALGHTSHGGPYGVCGKAFAPEDIRRMVNEACRVMGAPEAYRATS